MNKKVIIIVVAVILLVLIGGGGAAAYFILGASKPEVVAADAPQAPPPVDRRPSFLPIDPVAIFVQNEGRARREVTISVTLVVLGASNIPEVNERMPALRDAFNRTLYPLTFKVPKFWQAKDLGEVVKVMKDVSQKVFPNDLIGDVLITGVIAN